MLLNSLQGGGANGAAGGGMGGAYSGYGNKRDSTILGEDNQQQVPPQFDRVNYDLDSDVGDFNVKTNNAYDFDDTTQSSNKNFNSYIKSLLLEWAQQEK